MSDKVQLIAQPEQADRRPLAQETLEKLQKLADENSVENKEDKEEPAELKRSPSPSRVYSHETVHKSGKKNDNGSEKETKKESEKEDESEGEYDADGFKIPAGKIPLDGHFSAREIDQLILMAQDEGLLDEDVRRKVLERNQIGDKVIILEEPPESEEQDETKEEAKKNQEQDKKEKNKWRTKYRIHEALASTTWV